MTISKLLAKDILDPETQMHFSFINKMNFSSAPHNHDFYEIFLVVNGSVLHNINGTCQLLSKGSMSLIQPSDVHFYNYNGSTDFQFINIAFSQDVINALCKYLGYDSNFEAFSTDFKVSKALLSHSETSVVLKKIENLAIIPQNKKSQLKTQLRLILVDFLSNYLSIFSTEIKLGPFWLQHLIHEMKKRENFCCGVSKMESISKRCLSYISRVFKLYYGTTPTDFVNEIRLDYCANMMIYSDADIIDIAPEAGFNNLSHFYHLFKKKYGLSPLQFRKLHYKVLSI